MAVIRRLEQVVAWKVREEERRGLVVSVRGTVKVTRGWGPWPQSHEGIRGWVRAVDGDDHRRACHSGHAASIHRL
jgi:hypothetical protein